MNSGSVQSEFLLVTKGILQFWVLSSSQFILMILSLHKVADKSIFMLMTLVYFIADSVQLAIENLQLSFNALQDAHINLKLVLNAKKTKFMLFTSTRDIDYNGMHITTVNRSNIERVTEYKYLSILLDEKLTFNYHVVNLVGKLQKQNRLLRLAESGLFSCQFWIWGM